MATPNLLLTLPTVSVTLGPTWASQLNAALTLIDSHDHSSGKGVKVTPAGLDITSDLDVQSNNVGDARSLRFADNSSTLAGATDVRAVYASGGNLYYNNNAGTAVQITSGGGLNSSALVANTWSQTSVSSNQSVQASDSYVVLLVDTSGARTITLPAASAVSAGRFYLIKDSTGSSESNAISLARTGADTIDGATSQSLAVNYGAWFVVSDGSSKWSLHRASIPALTTSRIDFGDTRLTSGSLTFASGSGAAAAGFVRMPQSGSVFGRTSGGVDARIAELSGTTLLVGSSVVTAITGSSNTRIQGTLDSSGNFAAGGTVTAGTGLTVTTGSVSLPVSGSITLGAGRNYSRFIGIESALTYVFSGWTQDGDVLSVRTFPGPATPMASKATASGILFAIPPVDGATLASVDMFYAVTTGHGGVPTTKMSMLVQRSTFVGNTATTVDLRASSATQQMPGATVPAYETGASTRGTFNYACDQNNVITAKDHQVIVTVTSESGTNSLATANYVYGFRANWIVTDLASAAV